MNQERNEKTCDWEFRLRSQAKFCNFFNDDEQIFDQIVEKTNLIELRREAFKNEMNLAQLLKLANKIEKELMCTRCGSRNHRFFDKKCPALRHRCEVCLLVGHYPRYCFRNDLKREMRSPARDDVKRPKFIGSERAERAKSIDNEKFENQDQNTKKLEKYFTEIDSSKHEAKFREESEKWLGEIEEEVGQFTLIKDTPSTSRSSSFNRDPRLIKKEKIEVKTTIESSANATTQSLDNFPKVQKISFNKSEKENQIMCTVGDVPSTLTISDDYMVNVISKKFFDTHKIKCCIHGNKDVVINERRYTGALETRIERNGKHLTAEFYFSEEIKEEKCVITSHIAKKLGSNYK